MAEGINSLHGAELSNVRDRNCTTIEMDGQVCSMVG
jgi:hypothetical protein